MGVTWWDDLRVAAGAVAPVKAPPRRVGPPLDAGLPATFLDPEVEVGVQRPAIFDPALKQFSRAFRNGDPVIADPGTAVCWRAARRAAMDHVLAAVLAYEPTLLLRGSRVLRAWFGDAAREPGDLDLVAPTGWTLDHEGAALRAAIAAQAGDEVVPGIVIGTDVRHALLWTYERVPGCRVVLPWHADGVPPGQVQVDVVFGEHLPDAPEQVRFVRTAPGPDIVAPCASRALSLAWKLVWLATDIWPQGKDLYDAVLLAESTALPDDVLVPVLRSVEGLDADAWIDVPRFFARLWDVLAHHVDWSTLTIELGERAETLGDPQRWTDRLRHALRRGPAG